VIVYYWATWCNTAAADFARMKQVLAAYASKNVVLVAINIDDKLADVQTFFQKNASNLPAALHLHSAGSFESPAAMHYGLNVFPAMFLQDASGKITSNSLDAGTLEEELKKIVK
ncbi:MAG TPA: TlpA disulfide reductase family protein, partial [Gemmatales bacterium]|nr:TlpA disulfide reductase family protein [Gemmatales bacterium]